MTNCVPHSLSQHFKHLNAPLFTQYKSFGIQKLTPPCLLPLSGPSQCHAIMLLQPPATGKSLKTRPAFKSFIRAMRPACCPVRALFAWLVERFALEREPMPMPGTKEWRKFLLFPGRDGKVMGLSNHERIVLQLFQGIDVAPPKVTHEFRIFGAQAMHEMGVSLEVSSSWLLSTCETMYKVVTQFIVMWPPTWWLTDSTCSHVHQYSTPHPAYHHCAATK